MTRRRRILVRAWLLAFMAGVTLWAVLAAWLKGETTGGGMKAVRAAAPASHASRPPPSPSSPAAFGDRSPR